MSSNAPYGHSRSEDPESAHNITINRLRFIKGVHTLAWTFFVACIVAIPILAWDGRFGLALLFIGIVAIECVVIAFNSWHCPLTPIAARYTSDRRPNFDIYLPEWLARHNKTIFGSLYGLGILLTVVQWLGRR